MNVSKREFKRKIEEKTAARYEKEKVDLPEEWIERISSSVETEMAQKKGNEKRMKAKALANKIKQDMDESEASDVESKSDNKSGKEYFDVDVDTEASVRGVKYKGHTGIEITDFKYDITTKSNAAIYNKCEVFKGEDGDNFDVWGRFTGQMEKAINGKKQAKFEFYLRDNNLTVTYWQDYKYKDQARRMAKRAIMLFKEAIH